MKKEIYVSSFVGGYNTDYIRCYDLGTAVLAAQIEQKYYWYYCFICACEQLWGTLDEELGIVDWLKHVLNYFGMYLIENKFADENELHLCIKDRIDEGKPLLIFFQHSSRFYHKNYMKNNTGFSEIILSGYDDERKLTVIQDMYLTKWDMNPYFRGSVFGKLFIKNELLNEFWKLSIEDFKNENLDFWKNIYHIEKQFVGEIESSKDLVFYLLKMKKRKKNLIITIDKFDSKLAEYSSRKGFANNLILRYIKPLSVVFEILERFFSENGYEELHKWKRFTDTFIRERMGIVMFMSKKALQDFYIEPDKKEKMIAKILKQEEDLFDFVSEIIKSIY